MLSIIMEFDTSNAAFEGGNYGSEIDHVVLHVAEQLKEGESRGSLRDSNGNTVGAWSAVEHGEADAAV